MEQLWANWTILSTTQSQIQSALNHKAHHINHSEFLNVCPFAIWPISLELINSFFSYFIPLLSPFHKHPTFYKIYPKLASPFHLCFSHQIWWNYFFKRAINILLTAQNTNMLNWQNLNWILYKWRFSQPHNPLFFHKYMFSI